MKTAIRLATVLLAAGVMGCMQAKPGADAVYVNATLIDRTPEMSQDFAYGSGADMSKAPMAIEISAATVPAGQIVFDVSNPSTAGMLHEMVVSPLPANGAPMPFKYDDEEVDERAAIELGEVEDIEPGETKRLVLTLEPGQYMLYCNYGGHFTSGMWTILTVTL